MYRYLRVAVVVATIVWTGCAGQQRGATVGVVPTAQRRVAPMHPSGVPVLQPIELEKTDYRFRMIGGPYKVTSDNPNIEVVVNKHGVDPNQIDIQPTRTGPSVSRGAITVTDESTGAAFQFTVIVQK